MRRRFSYALTAGVLSSGAPAGLLGIRLARRDDDISLRRVRSEIAADRAAYMYIGGATALIFALFGYVLGRHADQLAELSETDVTHAAAERPRVRVAAARRDQARQALSRAAQRAVPRRRRPEGHQRSPRPPRRQRGVARGRRRDSRGAARNRHGRALGRRRVHDHRAEHRSETKPSLFAERIRATHRRACRPTGR